MNYKDYTIYIMSNFTRTVLYIGASSNLIGRVWQHKNNLVEGFTKKYNCHYLIYYESLETAGEMVNRERQVKNYSRKKKQVMILKFNPTLKDLYEDLIK